MNNIEKLLNAILARIESSEYVTFSAWDQSLDPDALKDQNSVIVAFDRDEPTYPNLADYDLYFQVRCRSSLSDTLTLDALRAIACKVRGKIAAITADALEADTSCGVVGYFPGALNFEPNADNPVAVIEIKIHVTGFEFEPNETE